jgi:sensor histidine kinase YesM
MDQGYDGPGTVPDAGRTNERLGLRLVRQRLEALYGERAQFEVATSPGAGFRVLLTIPVARRTPVVAPADATSADR